MPAALLTVAPSRRHQTAPACDVINVRQGRGEACARPGMVRGGPAPPWSRNDRRYRWRTPPSCPRAPCRTGTASGSATSTPRSPSERPGGRAGDRVAVRARRRPPCGTAPRPPAEPRCAELPLPAPPLPAPVPLLLGCPLCSPRTRSPVAPLSAPPRVRVRGCPRPRSTFGWWPWGWERLRLPAWGGGRTVHVPRSLRGDRGFHLLLCSVRGCGVGGEDRQALQ